MEHSAWEIVGAIAALISCLGSIAAVFVALYVNYDVKRPTIVAFLRHDADHSCMDFIVVNQGNGVAYDIQIQGFDYALADEKFSTVIRESFITKGIPALIPGEQRKTTISAGVSMGELADRSADVVVSFREKRFLFGWHRQTQVFTLDYYSFSKSLYPQSDLHQIKDGVQKIAKALAKGRGC